MIPATTMTWRRKDPSVNLLLALLLLCISACGDDGGNNAATCEGVDATANFPVCQGARNKSECEDACGAWVMFPFSGLGCQCPTGQEGQHCNIPSDCTGKCFAPLPLGLPPDRCSDVADGTCSAVEPEAGCWCQFSRDGVASFYCNDP